MNFLRRKNHKKSLIVVSDKLGSQTSPLTGRKSSDTSLDDEKVSLFYTEHPGKAKMTPIPTPPPSPPKSKCPAAGMTRPQSQPTPLTNSFHAEAPIPAASTPAAAAICSPPPCFSPSKGLEKVADETILDASRKTSASSGLEEALFSPPAQSPVRAVSSKLDSSMNGSDTNSK